MPACPFSEAPSVTTSPPGKPSEAARVAPSPMAPWGGTGQPWGTPAPPPRVPGGGLLDDPFAPLAAISREPEAGEEGVPGGPDTAIQYNRAGAFAGSPNFIWNDSAQGLQVNGNMYFMSPSGGNLSSIAGPMFLTSQGYMSFIPQSGNLNLSPTAGGVGVTVTGNNVISLSSAATGFVAIQGALFRTGEVRFPAVTVSCVGGAFQVTNSAQSVAFLTVNPNFGTRSPINMSAVYIPTSPVGLSDGDVWNNAGTLCIMGGPGAAAARPRTGVKGALMGLWGTLTHWAMGLIMRE